MCEVAGYWQELEHTVLYADPQHPKHAQWVTCPVSMLAMQELGCFQLPGIVYRSLQHGAVHYFIMLQHEVMVVDEWHNNGPQDLVVVSLCIQNAINKMHLCSLSITYACPYHNPIATMGHLIHNVDISKPLTHMTPYTLSAICPVQWKPLSTGEPLRACWPAASLSSTGTVVQQTASGQWTQLQRSSVPLSPPSWIFSLHNAPVKLPVWLLWIWGNRPFVYIEKVLDLWVQLMKKGGKKTFCIYNFGQCIINIHSTHTLSAMLLWWVQERGDEGDIRITVFNNPKSGVTQGGQEHTHSMYGTGQRNQGIDNTLNTELNKGN